MRVCDCCGTMSGVDGRGVVASYTIEVTPVTRVSDDCKAKNHPHTEEIHQADLCQHCAFAVRSRLRKFWKNRTKEHGAYLRTRYQNCLTKRCRKSSEAKEEVSVEPPSNGAVLDERWTTTDVATVPLAPTE